MYLVVHSIKTEEVTRRVFSHEKLEDHWSAHETYEDALKEYRRILLLNDLYSVSIAGVLRSTDYDSIPARWRRGIKGKVTTKDFIDNPKEV